MNLRVSKSKLNSRGQSLVETALMLPLLIMVVLNVVNLGYFFLVAVNLTGAARTATMYSVEGSSTPAAAQLPSSGGASPNTNLLSVTYLAFQDMTGALWNPTGASLQVCSPINVNPGTGSGVNVQGGQQLSNCETCTTAGGCVAASAYSGNPVPSADPEQPTFVLNQVDITYTFNTLIPGRLFNIPLQASAMCNSGNCVFKRRARMRAMN
jgi:hypothetical protein